MKIKLVADSSANVNKIDNADYAKAAMKILVGDRDFVDDDSLDIHAMQTALKEHKGKTSSACPSVGEWLEIFDGADEVYGVTITSKLSGSYNSALIAAEQYMEENPGKKVHIQDSLSTGGEMALVLEKYAELTSTEHDFNAVVEQVHDYNRNQTNLIFCLSSVSNLAKNGRVNPALAKVIGVLGIRIVGIACEGVLKPMHKCRGEKKALVQVIDTMKDEGYKGGKVRISHSDNMAAVDVLIESITRDYPQADIQVVPNGALCTYYAEEKGLIVCFES